MCVYFAQRRRDAELFAKFIPFEEVVFQDKDGLANNVNFLGNFALLAAIPLEWGLAFSQWNKAQTK